MPGRDDRLQRALVALQSGRPVIVLDDAERENEGDLIAAAEFADADLVNFMAREARGLICVSMTGADLDRLGIPMMVPSQANGSRYSSPFTVSVEAASGVTTGISASDRARTIGVLADPATDRSDIAMPGHVFPLRAHPDGLSARRGHTEASLSLMTLAGLRPAAVICEIMNEDGSMARRKELEAFSDRHNLALLSIDDITGTDRRSGSPEVAERVEGAELPTRFGRFNVTAYRDAGGLEHLLLEYGDTADADHPIVRVHSECLTGDALGSVRCDCGDQLRAGMERIVAEGTGALVYLRQEGRGIGLVNKIRAYALQDKGLDTVEANRCLGFEPDYRDYAVAARILAERGISSVRLMTNNPDKIDGLEANGVSVRERVSLQVGSRPENRLYLRTKAEKLAHLLEAD